MIDEDKKNELNEIVKKLDRIRKLNDDIRFILMIIVIILIIFTFMSFVYFSGHFPPI
ncbi:MAG: hypothetical protein ACFE9N_07605 [Promethearchaeota archaeon]